MVRAYAAFSKRGIYDALYEEQGVKYAIRLQANDNLERDIAELLSGPVGGRSHKPVVWYKSFLCRVASWTTAWRRVRHPASEQAGRWLLPDHGGQRDADQAQDKEDKHEGEVADYCRSCPAELSPHKDAPASPHNA